MFLNSKQWEQWRKIQGYGLRSYICISADIYQELEFYFPPYAVNFTLVGCNTFDFVFKEL